MARESLPDSVRIVLLERDAEDLSKRLGRLETEVDALTEDSIRRNVAAELARQRPLVTSETAAKVATTGAPLILTRPQKLGGLLAGALFVLDAISHYLGLY